MHEQEHHHDHAHGATPMEELTAMLRYMVGHNAAHTRELAELAGRNLEAARGLLMDLLCDYQGFRGDTLILVFDAYKVKGNPGEVTSYHNIHVVYTREAETADQYIEKVTHEMSRKNHRVRVATSDGLEQIIIMGAGAIRVSARELYEEIQAAEKEMRENFDISVE